MSKKSDMIEAFRAAGRLINEWQDTLLYSSLVAAETLAVTHNAAIISTPIFLSAAFFREIARVNYWGKNSPHIYAGYDGPQVDSAKNAAGAGCIAGSLSVGFVSTFAIPALLHSELQSILYGLPVGMAYHGAHNAYKTLKQRGGKLTDIWSLYGIFDAKTGMWDWARKRGDGGGDTQTKKLIDGIGDLAKKAGAAIGGALPQPGPRPVGGFARTGATPDFVG